MRKLIGVLVVSVAATLLLALTVQVNAQETPKLDADCEKVLVIGDFESDAEISNHETGATVRKVKPKPGGKRAIWIGVNKTKWAANRLEISDEHAIHGKHALKVHANVGSGHAGIPTVDGSFPKDWSDYDAIRYFVHWGGDKPVYWSTSIKLHYTNAEGKQDWLNAYLLYNMKPGDTHVEIPLKAYDDLKWKGLPGIGGGRNMTNMKLWKMNEKYDYVHKVGWKFNDVYHLRLGMKGRYDNKVEQVYWIDYVRLVKWKRKGTAK